MTRRKQNIYIGSDLGNKRIERAIPKLMKKKGFERDQATAVAIRMESVGQLTSQGVPLSKKVATKRGTNNLMKKASLLLGKKRDPKTTEVYESKPIRTDSVYKMIKKSRSQKPSTKAKRRFKKSK